MKPRDVRRAIKVQHYERAAGDAPALGHLGRMPGRLPAKGERRRRRSSRERISRVRRRVLLAWSGLFAVLAVVVLLVAVWAWLRPEMNRAGEASRQAQQMPVKPVRPLRPESPSEERALELVKEGLALRDPGQVGGYFRLGSANAAGVVEFLRSGLAAEGEVVGMQWRSSIDVNELPLEGVIVETRKEGVQRRNRLAFLTVDEDGQWKIDFDAFARTVKPPWNEILKMSEGKALVRVIVAPDTYYNGVFRDEQTWASYGMASPDMDQVLIGYCLRGSRQAAALKRILSGENRPEDRHLRRVTLEIRKIAGAEARQFEITRVLAEDWVLGEAPYDEKT